MEQTSLRQDALEKGQDPLEALKTYGVQVVRNKIAPAALAAFISALTAFYAAHKELLESWGVTYGTWPLSWAPGQTPSGPVILLELDTVNTALWSALAAIAAAVVVWIYHHTHAAVAGLPQSGDARQTPTAPQVGGERAEDK